jgi:hypothetical protein
VFDGNESFVTSTDEVEYNVNGDTEYYIKNINFINNFQIGDLIFNGWRLCNSSGSEIGSKLLTENDLVKLNEYGLDGTETKNTIYLYADMSIKIIYQHPEFNGREIVLVSNEQTIDINYCVRQMYLKNT